jgi:hypothetical protein
MLELSAAEARRFSPLTAKRGVGRSGVGSSTHRKPCAPDAARPVPKAHRRGSSLIILGPAAGQARPRDRKRRRRRARQARSSRQWKGSPVPPDRLDAAGNRLLTAPAALARDTGSPRAGSRAHVASSRTARGSHRSPSRLLPDRLSGAAGKSAGTTGSPRAGFGARAAASGKPRGWHRLLSQPLPDRLSTTPAKLAVTTGSPRRAFGSPRSTHP